jgi:hypothetical protein
LKIEDPISSAAINSNLSKFITVIRALGVSEDQLFSARELQRCADGETELEDKIFKVLDVLRQKFSRTRKSGRVDSNAALLQTKGEDELKSMLPSPSSTAVPASRQDQSAEVAALKEKNLKLEAENTNLRKQLEEYREVVTKLKLTIQSLDKINRNIVEDLHMELQFRAEVPQAIRKSSFAPDPSSTNRPSTGPTMQSQPDLLASQSELAADKNCSVM